MDVYTVAIGLMLLFYLLVIINEAYKMASSMSVTMRWLLAGFAVLIALAVAYYLWAYVFVSSPDEDVPLEEGIGKGANSPPTASAGGDDDDLVKPSKRTIAMPEPEVDFEKRFSFEVSTDPARMISEGAGRPPVTYADFKTRCMTPAFLQKYTEAIKLNLQLKRKRYVELMRVTKAELNAASKKGGDMMANMMNSLRNEHERDLKDLIERIERILKTIDTKYRQASVTDTTQRFERMIYHREKGLESLVGRDDVKDFLAMHLFVFAKNPRIFFSSFQNIMLMGGPGMGKTRIAEVMGHVFSCAGILIDGNVFTKTSADLVSAFVNDTAHKTRSFLMTTLESVTFIDEAYEFTPKRNMLGLGQVSHGQEAITEMVNFMDKMMGLNILIVGGYETELRERFLQANEGLDRRFPAINQIVLKPYSSTELTRILVNKMHNTNRDLKLSPPLCNYLYSLIDEVYTRHPEVFKNQAGDIINLAGVIASTIYGSEERWGIDPERVLLSGMNEFLRPQETFLIPASA